MALIDDNVYAAINTSLDTNDSLVDQWDATSEAAVNQIAYDFGKTQYTLFTMTGVGGVVDLGYRGFTGDLQWSDALTLVPVLGKARMLGKLGTAENVVDLGLDSSRYSLNAPLLQGFENATGTIAGRVGPVRFKVPEGTTPEELAQFEAYVAGSNDALMAGALSSTGRVGTQGALRGEASLAAAQERARAAAAGAPYTGHAGHVPDTTWTGNPQPHSWLDLSRRVNSSLGGQATRYPVGYKPTIFILE